MVVHLLVLVHVEAVNLLVILDVKVMTVVVLKVTIHVVVVLVVQGIVMANYLNNIANYKFDNLCIYYNHYNHYNLCNYNNQNNCHNDSN